MQTPNSTYISSPGNPQVKELRRIAANAQAAKRLGLCIAEGIHLAQVAFEQRARIETLVLREGTLAKEVLEIASAIARNPAVHAITLPEDIFESVSPTPHGAGILLKLAVPAPSIPQTPIDADALYLDGVQDAGNVGTLLRTALASGIRYAAAGPGTAILWSSKVLRSAMGAHFAMTLFEGVVPKDLPRYFSGKRLCADARGGQDLFTTADWEKGKTVWIMGSEGAGVSEESLAVSDARFLIPIEDDCESLNVAAAGAVCLFEQRRRRLAL